MTTRRIAVDTGPDAPRTTCPECGATDVAIEGMRLEEGALHEVADGVTIGEPDRLVAHVLTCGCEVSRFELVWIPREDCDYRAPNRYRLEWRLVDDREEET